METDESATAVTGTVSDLHPVLPKETSVDNNSVSSASSSNNEQQNIEDSDFDSDSDESSSDAYQYLDLSEILKLEIENGEYTCLICTGEIGITSKIWNCKICYRVYDLDCIKGWSKRGLAINGEWKCPSCNSINKTKTAQLQYTCWCGKVPDPYYNGHIPHSCGQTCKHLPDIAQNPQSDGKEDLNGALGCKHGCPSVCHPGPHAECTAIGPSIRCACGNHKRQWPCVITPYGAGWNCSETCQERMPCGMHRCTKKCHAGVCGKCVIRILSRCYCGQSEQPILCAERRPEECEDEAQTHFTGFFSCDKACAKKLSCNKHQCLKKCHVSTPESHICPTMPKANETCLCGKTPVHEILGRDRESCEEPIPVCDKSCNKLLPCGIHRCLFPCHEGQCVPCLKTQPVKCRCGKQEFDMPCKSVLAGSQATCRRKCTALMDCRRHRCGETCCEFEKVSAEHEKQRKKAARSGLSWDLNQLNLEDLTLAQNNDLHSMDHPYAHVCTLPCDRLLSCKIHRCAEKCHQGACHPCLEATYEDYVCPCGRTVVSAPIRCGSLIPVCHFTCPIPRPCGHETNHDCHDPSQSSCPPCLVRVEKDCDCGRTTVKGVLCSQTKVSCGRACGKALPCGHTCPIFCHTGPCKTGCSQPCEKLLPCSHKHTKSCHYPEQCDPGDCNAPALDICPCGHRRRQRKCHEKLGTLECDDSCAVHLRNKLLAQALGVDVSVDRTVRPGAAEFAFNDDLLDLYYADRQWATATENQILEFMKSTENDSSPSSLRLPPMSSQRRMFAHLYAEECQLQSFSEDSGPNRSVVLLRTPTSAIPPARLSDFVQV